MTTRIPMSYSDYLELPDDPPNEYQAGCAVVMDRPTPYHGRVLRRLMRVVEDQLPDGLEVLSDVAWKPDDQEWGPDLIVLEPQPQDVVKFTGTPRLLAEVLSSDRARDLVEKLAEYAAAGAPCYWVVAPRDETLTAHELRDGSYRVVARLGRHEPTASIAVGDLQLRIDTRELVS
ncbi:Uma2 family endonuclease [Motilibacter deserti]|uniref:Uma2 family endonuclease n=1 Tax=Motilibacter deserti TaxID=2714956 RepID=A0ABX0GXW2_9ACTN|nr:Uma2 family endonuclease [Motilibacter deserti]NHC15837.1 Uma2 family endonuclease [Motilibacter deserti]